MQTRSNTDPPDEQAAFAAFTKNVPQETAASRRQLRDAAGRKTRTAMTILFVFSLFVGLTAAIATVISRPLPLGDAARIAATAIIGAPFGGLAAMAGIILLILRASNRGTTSTLANYSAGDEAFDFLPAAMVFGLAGSVLGCSVFTGFGMHIVVAMKPGENPFAAPFFGAVGGAILCGFTYGAMWLWKKSQAPRPTALGRCRD